MNKSFILIISFFLCVSTIKGFTQKENVIKINLVNAFLKTPEIFYELRVNSQNSFAIGGFYTLYNPQDTEVEGWGLTAEFRIYLANSNAPAGVYIAPYGRYQNLKLISSSGGPGTFGAMGVGLVAGYQRYINHWLIIEGFLGGGYNIGSVTSKTQISDFLMDYYDGLVFRFGINVGFSF